MNGNQYEPDTDDEDGVDAAAKAEAEAYWRREFVRKTAQRTMAAIISAAGSDGRVEYDDHRVAASAYNMAEAMYEEHVRRFGPLTGE